MNQYPLLTYFLYTVLAACTVANIACARASTIVSSPLVPEGTLKGRPQAGEYDRINLTCGTALYPDPLFVGRVVWRTPSGELVPLLGVTALLETHGTAHASPTPTPITIEQDDNGRFAYRLTLWSDTLVYYKDDVAVGWEDIDDTATLTLHSSGCEPLRVKFTTPDEEHLLEMRCASMIL